MNNCDCEILHRKKIEREYENDKNNRLYYDKSCIDTCVNDNGYNKCILMRECTYKKQKGEI